MTCKDFDLLLPLHATGALAPDEAAQVEAHLAGCATCRAEAEADAAVLALAKLPPADRARAARHRRHRERRARRAPPHRPPAHHLEARRRRHRGRRRRAPRRPRARGPPPDADRARSAAEVATWEEPDLDTIWEDASVLDLAASAAAAIEPPDDEDSSRTTDDAVLARARTTL